MVDYIVHTSSLRLGTLLPVGLDKDRDLVRLSVEDDLAVGMRCTNCRAVGGRACGARSNVPIDKCLYPMHFSAPAELGCLDSVLVEEHRRVSPHVILVA